jgi:hypothetical protein
MARYDETFKAKKLGRERHTGRKTIWTLFIFYVYAHSFHYICCLICVYIVLLLPTSNTSSQDSQAWNLDSILKIKRPICYAKSIPDGSLNKSKNWQWMSLGILHRVALVRTGVSEEYISIFRVTKLESSQLTANICLMTDGEESLLIRHHHCHVYPLPCNRYWCAVA